MIEKKISNLLDLDNYKWKCRGKEYKLKKAEYEENKLNLFMENPVKYPNAPKYMFVELLSLNNCEETLRSLQLKVIRK